MGKFKLHSKYKPAGDQPKAIEELNNYINKGYNYQTLWGVTGSGKTFTMANIIEKQQKPTLIIAHNKTLAAQLAQEFKEFFPENAVHYFVSYYDYYQPEAYVSKTDTYIEKEATINEEINRFRHLTTRDLMMRKDVIIVASVSCIYGIGKVDSYIEQIFSLKKGKKYKIEKLIKNLNSLQYENVTSDFKPGSFYIKNDVLEIFPMHEELIYSIKFSGEKIEKIELKKPLEKTSLEEIGEVTIFPAKHTVTSMDTIKEIVPKIKKELEDRLNVFKNLGKNLEYERLKTKVEYDIEMMLETGYVSGIENYSVYLDQRNFGEPSTCLIDYFGDDFLTFIDESHITIPQVRGMHAGDRARKVNLVDNGFRLPSAMENRPLRFNEFESKLKNVVAVSATPGEYEITKSSNEPNNFFNFNPEKGEMWQSSEENRIIPQLIRPTGLLDPLIQVESMEYMVDKVLSEIAKSVEKKERMLITTITKRSSEELTDFLLENGVKVKYLHSDVKTLERLEILKELREGKIDVIVGVNLLREGLDLPEVSCVAIIDADKQGFLRSASSLIQIIGRAARNSNGKVLLFTEEKGGKLFFSKAMKKAISLTKYRRGIQGFFNEKNGVTPKTVFSSIKNIGMTGEKKKYEKIGKENLEKQIKKLKLEMDLASENLDFVKAAELRDIINDLEKDRDKIKISKKIKRRNKKEKSDEKTGKKIQKNL